jgi:hypothetical protein
MYIISKDEMRSIDARAICGFYIKSHENLEKNNRIVERHGPYRLIGYINQVEYSMAGNSVEILGQAVLWYLSGRIQEFRQVPTGTFDLSKMKRVVKYDGSTA